MFKENVVLVDADYLDSVGGRLRADFGQMLHRPIPRADLAEWLVCVAFEDGRGRADRQVVFVYRRPRLQNFLPADFTADIDAKAFEDEQSGEFLLSGIGSEEIAGEHFFQECVETLLAAKEVHSLTVVADAAEVASLLVREEQNDRQFMLLSMTPVEGIRSVVLGYSLMHAMGIGGEEVSQTLNDNGYKN